MTATGIDRAIEAHARWQHGAFSTSQAHEAGATPRMIERRRSNGRWIQMARSVWTLPSAPPTWHRQMMAATLSLPGSAASGLAAGHLHGLDGYRPVRPELVVARGGSRRSSLALVHQSDRAATTMLGPFRLTTIEQVVCDTAGRLGRTRIVDVVEAAVVAGATTPAALLARASGLVPNPPKGLAWVVDVAEDMAGTDGLPESVLEALLFRVLRDPRIPMWVPQASLPWRPASLERFDVLIPEWRLIIEVDGRRWHTRRADFERDRRRDQEAAAHGHATLRFTHHQLTAEPEHVLAVILRAGAHAMTRS